MKLWILASQVTGVSMWDFDDIPAYPNMKKWIEDAVFSLGVDERVHQSANSATWYVRAFLWCSDTIRHY